MPEATKSNDTSSEKTPKEEFRSEDTVLSPDGGWGWVVCFAVFWLNFGVAGTGTSNGIILLGLVDLYDEPISKAAMVGSIYIGSLMCAGPLVMILMAFQASNRQVIISGGLVACVSTIISVFAPKLELLYFTYGILTGCSVGMSYFAANTILASYFKEKRSLAVGIAFCGGGSGVFALNYLIEKSISFYGMRGTFLLLSGLFLNFTVFGALCRPLECPQKTKSHIKETKKSSVTNAGFESDETTLNIEYKPTTLCIRIYTSGITSIRDKHYISPSFILWTRTINFNEQVYKAHTCIEHSQEKRPAVITKRDSTTCKTLCSTLFDPVIFKNRGLQLLLIVYFIWSVGESLPIFLPASIVDAGLSREEAALIMSVYGATLAVGMIAVGMIADLLRVPISYILAFSMLGLSSTSISIPFCHSFTDFAFCTSIFAIFHAFTTALRVVLAASILGIKNINKSYSPVCLLIGVGYILFPLLIGSLYDATQSFDAIFFIIGGKLFLGFVASIGIIYLQVKGKFEE